MLYLDPPSSHFPSLCMDLALGLSYQQASTQTHLSPKNLIPFWAPNPALPCTAHTQHGITVSTDSVQKSWQGGGYLGVTLNMTKRRNKAVPACLHSLPPDQRFVTFLGHIPLYVFYETTLQIFPRKMNTHKFWLQIQRSMVWHRQGDFHL